MGRAIPQARRIMVVEDEMLIALDLEQILEEAGYEVVGPFRSSDDALAATTRDTPVDVAVLDVKLSRGDTTERVARAFSEAGRPFMFLTATDQDDSFVEHHTVPRLTKPVESQRVLETLRNLIDGGSAGSASGDPDLRDCHVRPECAPDGHEANPNQP